MATKTSPESTRTKSIYTQTLCCIGIILSSYALYVEYKTHDKFHHPNGLESSSTSASASSASSSLLFFQEKEESDFKALCDIEAIGASCSAIFNLPEGRLLSYFQIVPNGHLLDVPNAFLGLLYYTAIIIMEQLLVKTFYHASLFGKTILLLNSCAMSSSIFLAWKLYTLRELCILCITTHILNTLLLYHFVKRLRWIWNGIGVEDGGGSGGSVNHISSLNNKKMK